VRTYVFVNVRWRGVQGWVRVCVGGRGVASMDRCLSGLFSLRFGQKFGFANFHAF